MRSRHQVGFECGLNFREMFCESHLDDIAACTENMIRLCYKKLMQEL